MILDQNDINNALYKLNSALLDVTYDMGMQLKIEQAEALNIEDGIDFVIIITTPNTERAITIYVAYKYDVFNIETKWGDEYITDLSNSKLTEPILKAIILQYFDLVMERS